MKSVFIVLYNGSVSSEGYDTLEKAIGFIKNRYNYPTSFNYPWVYVDRDGNIYQIKEINIK